MTSPGLTPKRLASHPQRSVQGDNAMDLLPQGAEFPFAMAPMWNKRDQFHLEVPSDAGKAQPQTDSEWLEQPGDAASRNRGGCKR